MQVDLKFQGSNTFEEKKKSAETRTKAKNFSNFDSSSDNNNIKIQLDKKISELIMPLDKLSGVIVGIDSDDIEGIIEHRKSKIESAVTLTLPRDKNGNDITTYSRIFHSIGGGRNLV